MIPVAHPFVNGTAKMIARTMYLCMAVAYPKEH